MFQRHSPTAHAAYHDLLRLLMDDAVSEIRGAATRVERNGRVYWYDTYRVGSDVRKTYIGEDSDALRQRLARHAEIKEQSATRRKSRARLVRILRSEGFLGNDTTSGSLLAAMANAGAFRLGATIAGTHAFRLYEGELGIRLAFDQAAQTQDIDIASFERLSLALNDVTSPPLAKLFSDFSFDPVPSMDEGKTWRWRQTRNELLVEFLTPSFDEDETIRPLAALGVHAQAFHHLNYLLANPIKAAIVYRSGALVQIPRPERFAIHKLIVADRRRSGEGALKSRKDRMQAEFLVEVLAEDRPDDLKEAFDDAMGRGGKWRERIERSLKRSPRAAAQLLAL